MPEIQKVSNKHNEIMDYLIANPTMKLGDVAKHFGMSQPWLSCIIHSDIFQTGLKAKQDLVFHHSVLPLRDKMTAVAHQSLDRLLEQVPLETEVKTLNQVATDVLDRLGFGTKSGASQPGNGQPVNVSVTVLRSELEDARNLLSRASATRVEVQIDGERTAFPVQRKEATPLGETFEGEAIPIGI